MNLWLLGCAAAAALLALALRHSDPLTPREPQSSEKPTTVTHPTSVPVHHTRSVADVEASRPLRPNQSPSSTEKSRRIESIQRDYSELRACTSAEFAEIVGPSPEGLGSFLRQLSLIEREMREDLAAVLSPEELEDYDFTESVAGRVVRELLVDTAATEEQRRAVFRLQREYEDRLAFTFDETPAAMLQREQARQQTQAKIREELGDAIFATWLSGEGSAFGQIRAFAAEHHLPAQSAFELWRSKNDYDLARLEILARPGVTLAQAHAAHEQVLRQAYARISAIVGANAQNLPHSVEPGWLIYP